MDQREKAMNANAITRAYFDEILIEMRHIDNKIPDTTLHLYGETFSTPIMMAALSHLKGQGNEGDGMVQMAEGAKLANAVNWAGMGEIEQFDRIAATGARSIKIIKPYDDENMVLERMDRAEAAGALAVGMDLDHSFGGNGKPDVVLGLKMRPRTMKELESYVKRTKLPFIIKGVMTARGAQKAVEAGASAIVISNHGGRVLDQVPATAEVLPEIAEAVNGRCKILVDGGIRTGVDVFKALALGADAVLIARPFVNAIYGAGAEGVQVYVDKLAGELADTMSMCGAHSLAEITRNMVRV